MKIFSQLVPHSVDPLKASVLGLCAWAVWLGACSQTPVSVTLHSLQASGNVSFVCRGDDNAPSGHKLDECPDPEQTSRRLYGLVTQTATNEVAVVDLVAGSVVDIDPSTPGFSFLRVGARPGAIVTTPGGAATFVGVTGLQKNGVFALPTTCLGAAKPGELARDLTTWAACHLSSAPGDISVLVDPARGGDVRASCQSGALESAPDLSGRECPADLTQEPGPRGRRKLLVSLPDEHKLVLLDAQSLLDRSPGEFDECAVEATYALNATLPTSAVVPKLPPDLLPAAGANVCPSTSYPPPSEALPTPGGFALTGDQLYVADRSLPVVHVLDVSDPCAPNEQPPLLAYAYSSPQRVVTTSRVAVSPLTPSGKQFVYAIDESDQPTASVMAFDVSPGSTERTPLVFPGSPRQPYLPPDRLRFSAPVRDVSFVLRDFPQPSGDTGAGQFGLSCDPYPSGNETPASKYRPNADYTDGARPFNLRGVFAFAMLTSGQIAIIDVEDFDAPCRRPLASNASPFEDFRGCVADAAGPGQSSPPDFFTTTGDLSGAPTVSNESSCRVVEPHRPRSSSLSISSSTVGLRAPTLRAFPQFSNPDPAAVITADKQPRLLAVDFDNPDPAKSEPVTAQVNVSAQLYVNCADPHAAEPACAAVNGALQLELDPKATIQNSLTLPLAEPRSYAQDESPSLTFEGRVFQERTSGFLRLDNDPLATTASLQDPDANFCAAGVQDSDAMAVEADSLGVAPAAEAAWRTAHADYLQITGDFPAPEDVYWRVGQGQFCAGLLSRTAPSDNATLGGDHDACVEQFGNIDNPAVLKDSRDLSIVEASAGTLRVTPRQCQSDATCARNKLKQLACCFPAGTAYTVRASHQWLLSAAAGLHDMAAAASGRCVHTASCDPRKKYFHSRAFEVCNANAPFDALVDTDGKCAAGQPNVGCAVSEAGIPVKPRADGSQCIFENLTARFIVYRGKQPSTRGMSFSWQTTGGFAPLSMSLATQSSAVNPQSISYLPELGYVAVVDGSNLGLSLFDLNSLGVVAPSPFF